MDDKKEPRELTDQEKEILTKMENAESEEELMKLIEEIQKESKDANVTITPIKVPSKKFFLIRFIIECLLVGLVSFALISIFKPFTIVSEYGVYIYVSSIIICQIIINLLLRLIKHPFIILFTGIISCLLLIIVMCIIPIFMKQMLITNFNNLFFIAIFTALLKAMILPTLSKFIRG